MYNRETMSVKIDPNLVELASNFTVAQYIKACGSEDRNTIADALHRRFTERYVNPVAPGVPNQTHGFTVMAVSCLMIESLQSFREGWKDSNGKSQEAFTRFFDTHNLFHCFRGKMARSFWVNIRCGILHQAETTGGWKITRKKDAPLFDHSTCTISASLFLENLRAALKQFCDELKAEAWNSQRWKNVRAKMDALCANCKAKS